jgi:hypothetical protein
VSARSARVLTADWAWIGLVPGVRVEVIR